MESSRIFRIASDQCSLAYQSRRHCKRPLLIQQHGVTSTATSAGGLCISSSHTRHHGAGSYPWPLRCSKGHKNATGDPTLRWEVARGWRLGRQKQFMIWIAELQTRSRKMAPGISSGDNQSQDTSCASRLSVVSLSYNGRLSLIGQCRETQAK